MTGNMDRTSTSKKIFLFDSRCREEKFVRVAGRSINFSRLKIRRRVFDTGRFRRWIVVTGADLTLLELRFYLSIEL